MLADEHVRVARGDVDRETSRKHRRAIIREVDRRLAERAPVVLQTDADRVPPVEPETTRDHR